MICITLKTNFTYVMPHADSIISYGTHNTRGRGLSHACVCGAMHTMHSLAEQDNNVQEAHRCLLRDTLVQ